MATSAGFFFFLLVVLFAVAVVADNPYRYADLHADRVRAFDEQYAKRAPQVVRSADADGVYGWLADSPYIGTPDDQGACGSCYGFSARHTLVDMMATSTKTSPKNISVQFALACPVTKGVGYCYGGDPSFTANFMLSFLRGKGYPSDACSSYKPYKLLSEPACSTTCKNEDDTFYQHTASSLKIPVLLNQNREAMIEALKTGPLLAKLDASKDFVGWGQSAKTKNQVFRPNSTCVGANHAVEIIGYVNSTETPYWIVKNSWGTSWGDNGFVYVAAGNDPLCLESQVPISNGEWYNAVKDFPDFLAPYDNVAVDDPIIVSAAQFLFAESGESESCSYIVVDATQQVVQGYNFRIQMTVICPAKDDEEYMFALSWDLTTKTFTVVGYEKLDEVTPYVPASVASDSSTLHSTFLRAALHWLL